MTIIMQNRINDQVLVIRVGKETSQRYFPLMIAILSHNIASRILMNELQIQFLLNFCKDLERLKALKVTKAQKLGKTRFPRPYNVPFKSLSLNRKTVNLTSSLKATAPKEPAQMPSLDSPPSYEDAINSPAPSLKSARQDNSPPSYEEAINSPPAYLEIMENPDAPPPYSA